MSRIGSHKPPPIRRCAPTDTRAGRRNSPGGSVVTVDEVAVWQASNAGSNPHNFHIHGVQFQVADVNGEPPPAALSGWKDTMPMPPDSIARLVMRFTEHTDPTTPYMYHCHLLWHEDLGMMGQFVVEPGQRPSLVVDGHEHG